MEISGTTTAANRGSSTHNQHSHFNAIFTHIKTEMIKVMAWLSVIGGALC
jgi:hypothetical protein